MTLPLNLNAASGRMLNAELKDIACIPMDKRGDVFGEISVYGQEKTSAIAKLARLNLTVHGLSGDIKQVNTFDDDLIENNLRRIKILEEMAQSLYCEWFVHFRFPGHESTKMSDSALGEIPEGWEVKKLGELYNTGSGGTPSRKKPEYYEDGHIEWVKTKELKDGFVLRSEEKINELGLAKSSAKIFPENTVLIALYGATIGQLGILNKSSATNQACCAFLPQAGPYGRAFIFSTLLSSREDIINLRQGAAQQNISQMVLKNFEFICPPEDTCKLYNKIAEPFFDNLLVLQKHNQNLRATRDLLLPKLLTPSS